MRRLRRSQQQAPAAPATTERAWYVQPAAGAPAVVRAPRAADAVQQHQPAAA